MPEDNLARTGGCACGAVRFMIRGTPLRVGLCHCMTCRKEHAAAFNAFAVFRRDQFEVTGDLAGWQSSPKWERQFCARCGSPLIGIDPTADSEVEIPLGSFDEPGWALPQYETWVGRREPWLLALGVPQYEGNRNEAGSEAN
jgi:hypothetical protein